jgi:hypothetical protein
MIKPVRAWRARSAVDRCCQAMEVIFNAFKRR